MKKSLLLLVVLFPAIFFSQEIDSEIQKLSNKMTPDFCGCLEEYDMLKFEQKFGNCFAANIQKYESDMNQFFSSDTTEIAQANNDKFIQDLLMGMQTKLFIECPAYYDLIKNIKDDAIENLRSTDTRTKLDSLNSLPESERNHSYSYLKASMLFANKDYDNAKNEIFNGLNSNEDTERFKILLAWIYEEQNEIEKAVKVFDQLYTETGKIEVMLFREFMKSKLNNRKPPVRNCSEFMTGKFKMGGYNERRLVYIERTENMQIETCPEDNSITKMKIRWIDDCNYILKYIESTEPIMDEYLGKELNVTILETSDNLMRFKATMEGVEYVMIDEMQKVE